MRKYYAIGSAVLIVFLLAGSLNVPASSFASSAAAAATSTGRAGIIPGQYIVVVNAGESPEQVALAYGITPNFVYRTALDGFAGPISAETVAALKNDPRVKHVENDQWVSAFGHLSPAGIERIDTEQNVIADIDDTNDSPVNIDIAIIDTGVDLDHPDLYVYKATDCAKGGPMGGECKDGGGDDGNGHGTHVAGTAAAIDNGYGATGVAPGAKVWSVKVLGNDGSGWMSWIIAGVNWVTGNADQIDVANMSLGCECSSSALNEAIANSVAAGVTYVVAAGNSGKNASTFSPANHPDVITVSAIVDTDGKCGGLGTTTSYGNDDMFASFSNYGSLVEIAAPGVQIYSTYMGGSYATMSGTSMASPHVAGAAALYKVANPDVSSPSEVRAGLINSGVPQTLACDPLANNGYGGFGGDKDSSAEPLVYVGTAAGGGGEQETLTISDVSASPNPFSPNGDSIKETTMINASLSQSASWNVTIKDSVGNAVKTLGSGSGTSISVTWNGTDSSDSAIVADGDYAAEIVAVIDDGSGGVVVASSSSLIVALDKTYPAITSGPNATDITSSSATITWTTDEQGTSIVSYRKVGDLSYVSTGTLSSTTTTHSISLSSLSPETTYEYYVETTDAAGNIVISGIGNFTTSAVPTSSPLSVSFGSFSHEQKGKSGGAKIFIPVTVTGTNGETTSLDITIYESNSANGSYSARASGSTTLGGDGTVTFEYGQASCGKYYKAIATATTSSGSVASDESSPYQVTCS